MLEKREAPPSVLLITQNSYQRTYIKRVLKNSFFVIECIDSFSAVDWMKNIPIDLIILDQKTLDSTWVILCQHIRQLPSYHTTPILLITNNHKKRFFLEALNQGISDFIHEPLNSEELYQRVVVTLQTNLVNKKMTLITQKIKKQGAPPPLQKELKLRFVTTEEAIKEISKAKQFHRPLCLILLEIDDLKKLYELFPKTTIKGMIHEVENFLKSRLRKFDVLMPQGEGRFLILLPKTSHRAAMMIAETVRKEVHDAHFFPRKKDITLTFSMGVIPYDKTIPVPKDTYDQFEELLIKVDSALKEAKQQGNRVIGC